MSDDDDYYFESVEEFARHLAVQDAEHGLIMPSQLNARAASHAVMIERDMEISAASLARCLDLRSNFWLRNASSIDISQLIIQSPKGRIVSTSRALGHTS